VDPQTLKESSTLVATITQSAGITPEGVLAIGALVMALTQITLRSIPGDHDEYAPLFAILWSCVGAGLWIYSQPNWPPQRTDMFSIAVALAGIILTAMGAKGAAVMTTKTLSLGARKEIAEARERGEDVTPPALDPVAVPAGDRQMVAPVADPAPPRGRTRG
jgi:hypothetical protein